MNAAKNILIGIGIIAIILTLVFLVIGVKVVSTVFMYVLGAIAIITLIGFAIYYIGKWTSGNKNSNEV